MNAPFTVVFNWKMYRSYQQIVESGPRFIQLLDEYSARTGNQCVWCVPAHALDAVKKMGGGMHVALGAQDVSAALEGPYTGQTDVRSLVQLGVTYCVVAHPEVRAWYAPDASYVRKQLSLLSVSGITPLLFVQESPRCNNSVAAIKACMQFLDACGIAEYAAPLCIVYEPCAYADLAGALQLDATRTVIEALCQWRADHGRSTLRIFYGGGVTAQTVSQLQGVLSVDGYMVGKAGIEYEAVSTLLSLIQ